MIQVKFYDQVEEFTLKNKQLMIEVNRNVLCCKIFVFFTDIYFRDRDV